MSVDTLGAASEKVSSVYLGQGRKTCNSAVAPERPAWAPSIDMGVRASLPWVNRALFWPQREQAILGTNMDTGAQNTDPGCSVLTEEAVT